ncbi:multivesicular body subunit 12Bb isoform X3 [Boleophthalmus pectinirostris]|uniref:multivesicular body subunit 12Bb isoform X3 n=1 Tax=Boleophthalmus pectinirostris TaxID=150288 RepID=UPI00242DB713|nr:multivesicular body subunit 12Bb isoform X3 [Boleophthalmus pectinirostris]
MTEVSSQLPAEPISAVGIVASPSKAPDGFLVVAQTTDGSDADLWKDGLFKSKVTRYLCFTRNPGVDVVTDVKLTDIKDALPEGFTPLQETLDSKETATRKKRLCVRVSPRGSTQTAVYDIQIVAKSKYHLVNYTCVGEINNMFLWSRLGDVHSQKLQTASESNSATPAQTVRRSTSRPDCERINSGGFTKTDLLRAQRPHAPAAAASTHSLHWNGTDGMPGRQNKLQYVWRCCQAWALLLMS